MTRRDGTAVAAVLGLLWLASFALLFTLGSLMGLWPLAAKPRILRADLPAGVVFGAALGLTLLRGSRAKRPEA